MKISIHRIYARIFDVWRVRRMNLFRQIMRPDGTERVIDVGGYPGFWTSTPPLFASIDAVNPDLHSWMPEDAPDHHISVRVGDGRRLECEDNEYDLAFSNSVIEHVGSWSDQLAFAAEIRRVGRDIWVQTPARECFIEPHYLAPFLHWFPKPIQKRIVRWVTPWGLLSKPTPEVVNAMVEETRLIDRREMGKLFPDCEIHVEKLFGVFPKSYVAIRKC